MSRASVSILQAQLDRAQEQILVRLNGLTDAEFFWEPVPGCWTIRIKEEGESHLNGGGRWIYDYAIPDPNPAPFTTIAWRLVHIASINDMFHEHVFGAGMRDYPDQVVPHAASTAIEWWRVGLSGFSTKLNEVTDDVLVRSVSAPWGITQSVGEWVRDVIYENIHHGAEIGVLRDLYRFRTSQKRVAP